MLNKIKFGLLPKIENDEHHTEITKSRFDVFEQDKER